MPNLRTMSHFTVNLEHSIDLSSYRFCNFTVVSFVFAFFTDNKFIKLKTFNSLVY